MFTREDAIEKVRQFTKEILASGVPLDKVILFGSYTKGRQKPDSDIDVVLVSDLFTGFGFEDRKYFSKINIRKEFIAIEAKTYPSHYYKKGDPFIDEILKSGVEVYSAEG